MCWLPVDPPTLLADSNCSSRSRSTCSSAAQLLASRLRRTGDQLEKSWTSGGTIVGFGGTPVKAAALERLSSFRAPPQRARAGRRETTPVGREATTRRQSQQQMVPFGLE